VRKKSHLVKDSRFQIQ